MSVNRYEMKTTYRGHYSLDSLEEDDEVSYVRYEDYAALEQKLTDMAVQLANVESKRGEMAVEVELPDVEKWRPVKEVLGQYSYRALVIKTLTAAGIGVKVE